MKKKAPHVFVCHQNEINKFPPTHGTLAIIKTLCTSVEKVIQIQRKYPDMIYSILNQTIDSGFEPDEYFQSVYKFIVTDGINRAQQGEISYLKQYGQKFNEPKERYWEKFGNKLIEDTNKIADSLWSIRRLFDGDEQFIQGILTESFPDENIWQNLAGQKIQEPFLELIKKITEEHVKEVVAEVKLEIDAKENNNNEDSVVKSELTAGTPVMVKKQ
jgi:hypothetical protein